MRFYYYASLGLRNVVMRFLRALCDCFPCYEFIINLCTIFVFHTYQCTAVFYNIKIHVPFLCNKQWECLGAIKASLLGAFNGCPVLEFITIIVALFIINWYEIIIK